MSGALCFSGTRVPVKNLFDYLEGSSTLEDFLEDFPSISRATAVSVLEAARERLAFDATAAWRVRPEPTTSIADRSFGSNGCWGRMVRGEERQAAGTCRDWVRCIITVDKNLPFQQNLAALPIALIVLDSLSNELSALLPLVPALLRELTSLNPKSYTLVKLA
jgi:uncharacterized protein (DUF433 family)